MHTSSYGSAALVQRSRPALQIATNNLINATGSSLASMGAQSIPTSFNYPSQSTLTSGAPKLLFITKKVSREAPLYTKLAML